MYSIAWHESEKLFFKLDMSLEIFFLYRCACVKAHIKSVVAWKKSEHEKVRLIWKREKICKHLLLLLWATHHHHHRQLYTKQQHSSAKRKIIMNRNEVNSNMEIISSCRKNFTEVIAFFSLFDFFPTAAFAFQSLASIKKKQLK